MTRAEIATENEILRGVVGSTAHGTAISGQDDRDEMGVFIEPPEYVCGLRECDHYISRTQPEGVRSGPGDLDLTMYSLRKFCRLAAQGNPSVLLLLWLPGYITKTGLGNDLVRIRDAFVSREAGQRFLGYLVLQKMKLKGEKAHTVNRPELVEKYGYDTKFAMHVLRLGLQGLEYMTEGKITMPMREPDLSFCRSVREGKWTFGQALEHIERTETYLRMRVDECKLEAGHDRINRFLVEAHQMHWSSRFSSVAERRIVDADSGVRFPEPGPSFQHQPV